ncbi:MAG: hypothetical protein CMG02_00635 [Candidatus Marinimicrobia bacterium]|nr:hypothetical protein [Candidatus Neomarinimicrobiota bacterium]RPG05409.1 MAG: hypothetical protein CBE07_002270 [Pelagibacteraceae bacterium TMED247]|tara:strand:- start:2714 stop:4411 length:1698 start_codon:yes stop_codon:yes gene_type:complete
MKLRFFLIVLYTLITISVFKSSYGKSTNFNYNAKNISSYFSALISFHDYDYVKSEKFFKRINDRNKDISNHSSKYIRSLINLEKFTEAGRYSKILENKKASNFESNLILGLRELKKENFIKSKMYFNQLDNTFEHRMVFNILKTSLINWAVIEKSKQKEGLSSIKKIPERYVNFKIIQKTLAECYFQTSEVEKYFNEIAENKETNFSRYFFFYGNYLFNKNNVTKAKEIINYASSKHPKNLLINQYKKTLYLNEENHNKFDCKRKNDILAEIFYVVANALSTQGNYELSNFYISLSKYMNPNFLSYNSLMAENLVMLKKYEESKIIYKKLSKIGSVYKWYADRQVAFILDDQKKEKEAIAFLKKSYKNIKPDIFQTFDFANFLKDRKEYQKAIKLYSDILLSIKKDHELYPRVLDRRGTSYERINEWELAENDLLMSLKLSPDQPYVMNYLAYSWVEQGKNIDEALEMLKKANDMKKGDGYITDSIGWALFKLSRFKEAKEYLKIAVTLMPSDPIVNDHFADCLWENNEKIQARYFWNYVLKLNEAEEKLKKQIENKLIFGLEKT